MTIAGLHANEDLRRREFPVARDRIFLGHAGVCPLPQRVIAAVKAYASVGEITRARRTSTRRMVLFRTSGRKWRTRISTSGSSGMGEILKYPNTQTP